MNKKWTKVALAVTVVGTMVGCSSNDNAAPTPGSTQSVSKPAKFKVGIGTEGLQYIEGSPNINEDEYTKKLREISKSDVTLELIPHREFDQKLTLLFAGGDLPDLLQTHGINKPEVAPAVDTGVIIPLNDLIDKYGPNLKKIFQKKLGNSQVLVKTEKSTGSLL